MNDPKSTIQSTALPNLKGPQHDNSSLSLVDDIPAAAPGGEAKSKIRALNGGEVNFAKHDWKRKPHTELTGAVRMKSFHGRLSDNGLEYLDNSVNEWLDAHPEVEVKFVTSTVGLYDGKIKELALILNVWY
jgi:hypothetical protein